MKYAIEKKGVSIAVGIIVYLVCGMAMYMDIPKCIISVILDISESSKEVPLVIYSQKNIEDMKKQCRCWIGCSCLINLSNKLAKNMAQDKNRIDVMTISPTDLKVIFMHKIMHTPAVISQIENHSIYRIASYTLYDTVGIFNYFADGVVNMILSKCQEIAKTKYRRILVCGGVSICITYILIKEINLAVFRRKLRSLLTRPKVS